MKKIFFAWTFLLAVSGSALAADAVIYEPAPETAPAGFVWTGGYLGLQAGYAWVNTTYEEPGLPFYPDYRPQGFIGGPYLGYNYEFSNQIVFGAEADFSFGDVSDRGPWRDASDAVIPNFHADADLKWSGAVRARLGYAVDRVLPYISGGLAFARFEHGSTNETPPGATESIVNTFTGWTLGAGADYALTDNVILKAEYRYADFGTESIPNLPKGTRAHTMDLRTQDFRSGVAYKF